MNSGCRNAIVLEKARLEIVAISTFGNSNTPSDTFLNLFHNKIEQDKFILK